MKKKPAQLSIFFLVADLHLGGGGERVTVNLANYFASRNYRTSVVSLSAKKGKNIYSLNDTIQIVYLNAEKKSFPGIINKFNALFAVNRYFRKFDRETIVLGIGNYPSLLLSLLINRKIKTIGCQHLAFSGIKHIWSFLRALFFRRLTRVVSLTVKDLPKYLKINNNSIVIPNSITTPSDHSSTLVRKQILFIGRMVPEKGYDLLFQVIKNLGLDAPDWHFRIVGDGPLRNQYIQQMQDPEMKERISWIASTDNIGEEFLESSIYLMTSRTEGLPMVLLEAQSYGLPILSFNCETGPSDIVNDSIDGFLINDFNIQEMTEKILLLCRDYELRKEFGRNARSNVQKFHPDIINVKWENLFKELTEDNQ